MEKNVGGYDRLTRWVVGGGLMAYGLTKRGWKRSLAWILGSNLLGTAGAARCFVNKAFGFDTRKKEEPRKVGKKPLVQEASEESFPASDAPAWTAGAKPT